MTQPISQKAAPKKGLGQKELYLLILDVAWSYKRTMWYLLRRRGLKALLNFLYVKTLVPAGEGHGGAFYLLAHPLIRRFPQLAPYPRYVEIEVTTICNLKCIICEHTYWTDQEQRHLSFDEFRTIVDQFPGLKWTNLTGEGSAFLNKDYIRMIEYLKAKDIPVYLTDHFQLVNRKVAEQLVKIGVDGIYISFDAATKETYEKIKVGCNYDVVLKNIRDLIAVKKKANSPIPEICFRYTINKYNASEMPLFVDLVATLGDKKALGDGSRIDFGGLLTFKEIEDMEVKEIPQEVVNKIIKKRDQHKLRVMYQHSECKDKPPVRYCMLWMEPYIMMGGYVLPCCAVLMSNQRTFLREHAFGNVFGKPFREIWNSHRYRVFRQTVNDDGAKIPLLCRGCRTFDTTYREDTIGVDLKL